MRIGLVSDIHGNLHALQAVINDISNKKCDQVIFLGDYVFSGIHNNEIIDLLSEFQQSNENIIVLKGNIEDLIYSIESKESWIYPINFDIHNKMEERHTVWIKSLQSEHIINVDDVSIKFIHNPCEEFLYDMKNAIKREENTIDHEAFLKLSMKTDEDVLVFGHYHLFLDECINNKRFICPSSVGTPFNGLPKAQYMLLDITDNDICTQRVQLDYEIVSLIETLKNHDYSSLYCENMMKYIQTIQSGHNYL